MGCWKKIFKEEEEEIQTKQKIFCGWIFEMLLYKKCVYTFSGKERMLLGMYTYYWS